MNTEHTILCGGLNPAGIPAFGNVMPLNLWPGHGNKTCVKLKIEDLHERICQTTPQQFHDLIEIAAYVYCADQLASRGGKDVDTFGSHWRRRFHYHIPVREPDLWRTPAVSTALRELLDFLSDDFYDFTFYPAKNAPGIQGYLGLDEKGAKKFDAERVMLFSGGLDSLAGAIEEAVSQRRRVVLMNHRSTEKFCVRHQALLDQLAEKAGPGVLMPMRVRISKAGLDGKDYSQRARSFLFGSVAASVAMMLGVKGIRFYENGVVSLNLPVCAQVVGSRSTRTTHPRVLAAMRHLFSLLAGQDFMVDNPFWKETKGEVIRRIVTAGCAPMIKSSRSCAHTWETSNEKPHCGLCSQCIDRRFGMLAAGAEDHDPLINYKVDIFTESREKDADKIMGASFLERANQVAEMKDTNDFLMAFPEVRRALPHLGLDAGRGADLLLALYRRHADEVNKGVDVMLARHAVALRKRKLPGDCLLWTVHAPNSVHVLPTPEPVAAGVNGAESNLPRYFIRKELGVWRIRVDGKETVAQDCRAMELVAWLLMNPPDEAIHASVLEHHVDGGAVTNGSTAIDYGDNGDIQTTDVGGAIVEIAGKKLKGSMTLPALKQRIAELKRDRDDDSLASTVRQEAEDELTTLLQSYDRGGKVSGQAELAVERVRKAIKTLINDLKAAKRQQGLVNVALCAFGEHLEQNLWLPSMGGKNRAGASGKPGCFIYEPPAGVRWKD
jgi:7-cyano-7-deazaguanine synthase in queuosine biosynthesis